MKNNAHKIGAIFYVLWGILHVWFGGMVLYKLSVENGTVALAAIGTAVLPENLPQNLTGVASAVLAQHAWNLVWFGLFSMIVGIAMNWKNSRIGYWLNLVVVSAADLGFVFAILFPGYIRLVDGIAGPVLWVLAVIFTTIGIRNTKG